MNDIAIEPLHPNFGAEVRGLDLSVPLNSNEVRLISDSMDRFSLLVFRGQAMTDNAHLELTRHLGEPEPSHGKQGITGEIDYFGSIGNVIDGTTKLGNDDVQTQFLRGNELWHTDSSFRKLPAKFSINHAYEVPGAGGDTQFVSTRVAYEKLDTAARERIDDLYVLHDYVFSRSQVAPVDPRHAASLPPVEHKLVQTNPNNGCKNFYVGSHARSIVDWDGIAGRELIDGLLESATSNDAIITHQWQVGDTVIWDNRCLLHRGTGYDADKWRRLMRQTRVAGDPIISLARH